MAYKLNERQTYTGKALKVDRSDYSKYLFAGFIASCAMVIALAWSIS